MIINSKWWETPANIATMVRYQCRQAIALLPDFGETAEGKQKIVEVAAAVSEPEEWRHVFVEALLEDPEAVVCRCGECGGREWTVGSKLHEHFVDLLDRGRSLNFVEPQEEEAV